MPATGQTVRCESSFLLSATPGSEDRADVRREAIWRADLWHRLWDSHPPAAGHACRQALRIPGLQPEVELLGQILLELLQNPPAKPEAILLKMAAFNSNTQSLKIV